MTQPIDLARLTRVYRKIRQAREDLAAQFKKDDQELVSQLDVIEAQMLEAMKASNMDSFKSEHGTVTRRVKSKYWTSDWASFKQFAMEQGELGLLENRIAQRNMDAYLAAHPDKLPPGLQCDRRYAVEVRKPTNKPE